MPEDVNPTANAEVGISDVDLDTLPDGDTGDIETPEGAEEPQLDELGEPLDELNGIPEDLEEEQAPVEALPAEAAEQPATEALPEGVQKATDGNGREYYKLRPNRYEAFHGAHKTLKALEPIFGQPLTPETAPQVVGQAVANAQGFDHFKADFLSGDPRAQGGVLNFLFGRAEQALQRGEVANDPIVPFAEQFVTTLRGRNSAAYARVATPVVQDVIAELYQDAVNSGNEALLRSIQHVDNRINRKFSTADEIKAGLDPMVQRERFLEQREQALQQEDQRRRTEQWQQWTSVVQRNEDAQLNSAIDGALQAEAPKFEKFPKLLTDIKESLRTAVMTNIRGDAQLQSALALGMQQAQRAASPAVRENIANDMISRVIKRAQLVIANQKADIIRERTQALRAQSNANHQRRQAAQKQTAPSGGGTPVRRSAMPNGSLGGYDIATSQSLEQDVMSLLSR